VEPRLPHWQEVAGGHEWWGGEVVVGIGGGGGWRPGTVQPARRGQVGEWIGAPPLPLRAVAFPSKVCSSVFLPDIPIPQVEGVSHEQVVAGRLCGQCVCGVGCGGRWGHTASVQWQCNPPTVSRSVGGMLSSSSVSRMVVEENNDARRPPSLLLLSSSLLSTFLHKSCRLHGTE